MQNRIGEEMDAVVTGVEEFGLFVQGIRIPAEGLDPRHVAGRRSLSLRPHDAHADRQSRGQQLPAGRPRVCQRGPGRCRSPRARFPASRSRPPSSGEEHRRLSNNSRPKRKAVRLRKKAAQARLIASNDPSLQRRRSRSRFSPYPGRESHPWRVLNRGGGERTKAWAAHAVSSKSSEGHGVPRKKARTVVSMKSNTLLPC